MSTPPQSTWAPRLVALILFIGGWSNVNVLADEFWAHSIATQTNVAYGDHALQTMDIFRHGQRVGEPRFFEPDMAPRPNLVWIHGGGWIQGDKSSQISYLIPYLQRGWNVYNLNYRQGPDTEPLAVDDVMCAYYSITEQMAERGESTDNIVVSGASAGGHLALIVGLLNTTGEHPCRTQTPPRAVVNWYGITDIEQVDTYLQANRPQQNYARIWAGSAQDIAQVSADYSPLYLISDKTPPIISIHGSQDSVVPYEQSESLHASLSTPNELVTLDGGNHGGFTDAQYQDAYRQIFAFLDAQ